MIVEGNMFSIISRLWMWANDKWAGKPAVDDRGGLRSDRWPTVRKHHLAREGECQWCRRKSSLQVHHMLPFHLDPGKELDDSNLITLCEGESECHLIHGHNGNWKSFNPDIRKQCDARRRKGE